MVASAAYTDCAQSFIAMGDGLLGVEYYIEFQNITVGGDVHCQIQTDFAGLPSGTVLGEQDTPIPTGSCPHGGVEYRQGNFVTVNTPIALEKGVRYWAVWHLDGTVTGDFVSIASSNDLGAGTETTNVYYSKLLPAGAWTASAAGWNIYTNIDFANYEEVVSNDYYQSGTTIICRTNGVPITIVDAYYTIYRGKVSYYYGTVTTDDIFDRLIGFDQDVTGAVYAGCETTFPLYQTRGKSVGECFRELCDTFETTGAFNGYQHVIAAYRDDDDHDVVQVGFGPRPVGRIFSHGADSVVDDEIRITSVNLKRTTSLRPASVIVVGKAATGAPIIVQRDDRALATSFRTQSKMALVTTHTDESINTLADADRKAWQILDSFARNTWEGTITVAGVFFFELVDLNVTSPYYGAGGHIHLNYSPLGIVNVELHVKGIVLHENTTEIQITNADLLMVNALTDARGRAERSESFIAPDDPFTTVFASGYTSAVEVAATMYMQLCTADSTIINDGVRVLCTRTANSHYNDSTYHAEFETDNGYTIDGTNHIIQLELWDAASGGARHATVALLTSEHFPKWRTTRVIAEIHCKAA
jgi:hypothetical protein